MCCVLGVCGCVCDSVGTCSLARVHQVGRGYLPRCGQGCLAQAGGCTRLELLLGLPFQPAHLAYLLLLQQGPSSPAPLALGLARRPPGPGMPGPAPAPPAELGKAAASALGKHCGGVPGPGSPADVWLWQRRGLRPHTCVPVCRPVRPLWQASRGAPLGGV